MALVTDPPVTIDLGLDRAEPTVDRPWPLWSRLRSMGARRWLAVVLALTAVSALTGSVGPAPSRLTRMWSLPVDWSVPTSHRVADGRLYLVTDESDGRVLRAHRLRDGEVLWRASLPEVFPGSGSSLTPVGDVLLVYGEHYRSEPESGLAPTPFTLAYDPDTGEPIWSHEGWLSSATGDLLVLEHTSPPYRSRLSQRTLEGVDPRTGEVEWAWRVDENTQTLVDRAETGEVSLITLDGEGVMRRLDPRTGQVLAETTGVDHRQAWLSVTDHDLLVVVHAGGLDTYHRETLAPRWARADSSWLAGCGPVICGVGEETVRGLDPITGTVRWSWSCRTGPEAVGFCRASGDGSGDRVWIDFDDSAGDGSGSGAGWLVDAATGRLVADLGRWTPSVAVAPSTYLVTVRGDAHRGPVRQPRPVPVEFGLLGPDLTVTRLGTVPAEWWESDGRHVVAVTPDGLDVWRLG